MPIAVSPDADLLGRVGTALADTTRRRSLTRLLDGPAYPAELAEALGHADLMRELVDGRRRMVTAALSPGRRPYRAQRTCRYAPVRRRRLVRNHTTEATNPSSRPTGPK